MIAGYLTTDDVNWESGKQFADERQDTLHAWLPKDGVPDERFDVLIYDLDYLAFDRNEREQLVQALSSEKLSCLVAVHSHNLDDAQIEALRSNGVFVFRRLEPELFDQLGQAATPFTLRESL